MIASAASAPQQQLFAIAQRLTSALQTASGAAQLQALDVSEDADALGPALTCATFAARALFGATASDAVARACPRLARVRDVVERVAPDALEAIARVSAPAGGRAGVIYFYEAFAQRHDRARRQRHGVYYTPTSAVRWIVRGVHALLERELGLEDGLASMERWGAFAARAGAELPTGVEPSRSFVKILDPAMGTGAFLLGVVEHVEVVMRARWGEGFDARWPDFVARELLPRLHGRELMLTPWVLARLLMMHALGSAAPDDPDALSGLALGDALTAKDLDERFTVVIGNPPFAVTSASRTPFTDALLEPYKRAVAVERGRVALEDDYLKFLRLTQAHLASSGAGVTGLITNRSYLRGIIHRGVRASLLQQFSRIHILDLHGDSNLRERTPEDRPDENIFGIRQGVAIALGLHAPSRRPCVVSFAERWGRRAVKLASLERAPFTNTTEWRVVRAAAPHHFFAPFDARHGDEYARFPSITELMPVHSCGLKTHRDRVVIDLDRDALVERIRDIAASNDLGRLREKYGIKDTRHWTLAEAKKNMRPDEVERWIHPLLYRPFDRRWIYYNPSIIEKGDAKWRTLKHMVNGENLALITARIQVRGPFDAVLVADGLVEMKTAESTRSCTVFPLLLPAHSPSAVNLDAARLRPWLGAAINDAFPSAEARARAVFAYIYATLHDPEYREKYASFLRVEFPRVPPPASVKFFGERVARGHDLMRWHLRAPPLAASARVVGDWSESTRVERITFIDQSVWIDRAASIGFAPVSDEVWRFTVGGYPVCKKWLRARVGRAFDQDLQRRFLHIIGAIEATSRRVKEPF